MQRIAQFRMSKSSTVFGILNTAGYYRRSGGWTACDACSRSSPTVRPDSGCCPDTVVVTDGAACLPTTAAPASGRTVIRPKFAAAGTGADDIDVQECFGNGAGARYSDDRRSSCPRRVRAVDVVEERSRCRSGKECLTRRRVEVFVVGELIYR